MSRLWGVHDLREGMRSKRDSVPGDQSSGGDLRREHKLGTVSPRVGVPCVQHVILLPYQRIPLPLML